MIRQRDYWKQLVRPGITALVGAGGKTTVLTKLVEYGEYSGQPLLVTTTTRLYETQVAQWNPSYGDDFNEADHWCSQAIQRGRCSAWFSGIEGTKVQALTDRQIEAMAQVHPDWQILVEADGAKEKWLKAPKKTEPVIPSLTATTIGVLNLQMLTKPLSPMYVHNLPEVCHLLEREEGAIMTPFLLARLVLHKEGLFQYSKGKKVLFCTGYNTVPLHYVEAFLDELQQADLEEIFLADGYKASCEIRRRFLWKS